MCPVNLTQDEWKEINSELPDVEYVCSRIVGSWDYAHNIFAATPNMTSQIRISSVCFRDAANQVRNAHYALGQAVAVRKYFLAKSKKEQDNDYFLADIRSRFYADYVALLIYASAEHICVGLGTLLGKEMKNEKKLNQLKKIVEEVKPNSDIANAVTQFDASTQVKQIWNYRRLWVHSKPPRVETFLYDPPRVSLVAEEDGVVYTGLGASFDFDYKWEELIDLFKIGLADTAKFLNACADEWENTYHQA
jgi:hypothetical protein